MFIIKESKKSHGFQIQNSRCYIIIVFFNNFLAGERCLVFSFIVYINYILKLFIMHES